LEDLYIFQSAFSELDWIDKIESALWLERLHPFAAVKNLYLSVKFSPNIEPALHDIAEARSTEVLPVLQNIFLEGLETLGPVQEGIRQFVAMRQVTGY
jgi:hypothetical protein